MNLVCPDCNQPLEILKACGCVDYFCNHCNQLVSKKRAIDLNNVGQKEIDDKLKRSSELNNG